MLNAKLWSFHFALCILHSALIFSNDVADVDIFCVGPEALQVVELSGLVGEDVDDHGAEVQQLPGVAPVALAAQQRLAQVLQGQLGVVAEGLDMGVGGACADQEVISQRADLVDLQQLDAHALLGVQSLGSLISDGLCR